MAKDYILVILATVLLAVEFTFQKLYQKQCGTGMRAGLTFNTISGLVTAFLFLLINQFHIEFSPFAVLMAGGMCLCLVGYTLLGFQVMKAGNMALYTLFLMTGGMVVPYVWGLLFLNEPFSLLRLIGLLVIIGAILLSNSSTAKSNLKILLLCLPVFLLNGGCSVFSKLCQTENPYGTVSPTDFVFLTGILRFVLCAIALLVTNKKSADTKMPFRAKTVLPIILIAAVVNGTSYALQLVGAAKLPATVLYPIVSGGSIIFSAIAGLLCFREKPDRYQKIGIVLCFLGTCLFL